MIIYVRVVNLKIKYRSSDGSCHIILWWNIWGFIIYRPLSGYISDDRASINA